MTNNEINVTATCIAALATQPNSIEKIKLLLSSLLQSNEKADFYVQKNTDSSVSSKLIFTQKEISKMATTFKKVFIANGLCAHVLKKPSGKNSYCYEIRYRSNGYDIRAYSTDLTKAKELFIAKTTAQEIEKYRIKDKKTTGNLFCHIFEQWHQYK